jgi:hypothetical protein
MFYLFHIRDQLLRHFRNHFYTDGRTPWTSDQPVARPLPTHRTTQTQNKRTQRHSCLEWDSNPRPQCSSEPLWSAAYNVAYFIFRFTFWSVQPYPDIHDERTPGVFPRNCGEQRKSVLAQTMRKRLSWSSSLQNRDSRLLGTKVLEGKPENFHFSPPFW